MNDWNSDKRPGEREFEVPVNPDVVKAAGTKKKISRIAIGVVIALVLVIAIMLLAGNTSGGSNEQADTGDVALNWPAAEELGVDLPKPDGKLDEMYYIGGGFLLAVVENQEASDCKDYFSKCVAAGWTEDQFMTDDGTNYNNYAKNSSGWALTVYNINKRMVVQLYASDYFDDLNGTYQNLGDDGEKALNEFFRQYSFHDILNAYCAVADDYIKLLAGMNLGENEAEARNELQQMKEEIEKVDSELEAEDYDSLTVEKEWYYFTALLRIQQNM